MIHTLADNYKWSKSQVNEVYPEEAVVLLKFLAFERKDKILKEQLDYYKTNMDLLYIQHGDPDQLRNSFTKAIEKIQNLSVTIKNANLDDDLPDFVRLKALKDFVNTHHNK